MTIVTEQKGSVVVHTTNVPVPIEAQVVRLDMLGAEHGEHRYRIRVGDTEGRVTVTERAHFQREKRHCGSGIYALQRGWIAVAFYAEESLRVSAGFARVRDRFCVCVPGNTWYMTYVSENAAFTYASSDNQTGETRDSIIFNPLPDESELITLFAQTEGVSTDQVREWITLSR